MMLKRGGLGETHNLMIMFLTFKVKKDGVNFADC